MITAEKKLADIGAMRITRGSYAPRPQGLDRGHDPARPNAVHGNSKCDLKDTPAWLIQAHDRDVIGEHRKAIGIVFRTVDTMLRRGEVAECNAIFEKLEAAGMSREMMLAFLVITKTARGYLPSRADFYEDATKTLERRGEDAGLVLRGLE
jgi:hypothetical protein